MKKNICIGVILVIFGFHFNGYAQVDHSQSVHRHIVQQAWRLLHSTNPCFYNNTELKTFIGTSETDGPWSFNNTGRVVAGAFREDDEDVIWNFCCPNVWPFVFVYSTSHFWYAPDPNSPGEQYSLSDWCGLVPWYCHPPGTNWHRLRNYILGGWFLNKQYSGYPSDVTFQRWDGQGTYRIISYGPISFSYQGLVEDENGGNTKDLYHTGYMKIMGYWLSPDMWQSLNPPLEIRIVDGSNKYFCYEILGRMSHCLSDMSVPAHTHLDPHPSECWDGDSYEEYWFADYLAKYSYYNAGGSYINPFVQSEFHPVYYLAFLMTQVAGHFPSNDCDRYSNIYNLLRSRITV